MPKPKFQKAVEATPEITKCYQQGLKAMGRYSTRIKVDNTSNLDGSVDIDSCLAKIYPNESRWDYAFAYQSQVYFVEVHPAQSSEVKIVIKKLDWLKNWLRYNAPEIYKMKANKPYYWISTKNVQILKTSPQFRKISTAGLISTSSLKL